MKLITLFFSVLLLAFSPLMSQDYPIWQPKGDTAMMLMGQPPLISEAELLPLRSMPPMPVPDLYKGANAPALPSVLNNSLLPYFRPVFNQAGYSCGQATLVSHNFTYEINRIRGLSSSNSNNQYPTHFAWNWINGGNGWFGGSYFHSAEMLKHVGTPNVTTYGGMAEGGDTRWMSGYSNYYNAMQNRIYDAFAIDVSTIEGLNILKHYLHDHLEESPVGGVASFYANQPTLYSLPAGTPEAGKKVVISWVNSSHAMTIVGYNDSIRWDYNGDGQYTNHLDINGDGVVDLRDWEIGGLLMVNTFGGVPGWGDGGFAYMMYKTLADPFGNGGIWNNAVHVVKPKLNTQPQLTMKVTLKHSSRDKIRVTAGLSLDPNATAPTIEMDFPIFDFQGGNRFMQGGTSEADKTIEFGLDITPLLSHVPSGQAARYFLRVQEKDPNNIGTGEVLFFSVRDYTNGMNEFVSSQAPTPIIENGLTTLWVNATVNYNPVVITTEVLPDAKIYEPYSYQLQATGGSEPYHWYMKYDYPETVLTAPFPQVSAQQLTPTNSTSGYATKVLDFDFPFYGELYNEIYLHVNGIVLFDRQNYPWPYFGEPMLMFRGYRGISLFNADLRLYSGQGIWYEGDENSATFRWKASLNGNTSSDLNFAVKLYPDGKIELYYGNMLYPAATDWIGGISNGDYRSYQLTSVSGSPSIVNGRKLDLLAPDFVYELELSSDGTLQCNPEKIYNNQMVQVMAVDNNTLFKTKTFSFSTRGFQIDYNVLSGNNNVIGFGESAVMDITLISMESQPITNATMHLSIEDEFITLVDSLEQIIYIAPGDTIVFQGAFTFDVSNQVPNNHPLPFGITITSADDTWQRQIPLTAFAPVVSPSYVVVQDGNNGILDPGETVDLLVYFANQGGAAVSNVNIVIETSDPEITINNNSATIPNIGAGSGQFATFNITASENLEIGQMVLLNYTLSGDNDYVATGYVSVITGILVENFESGSFNQFQWQHGGHQPWVISGSNAYEGTYCARSGVIDHDQESLMLMNIMVTVDDSISFYRKVSSESGYDFLKFYIDNAIVAQWSGEVPWGKVTFPISQGLRTIKWAYTKDQTVVAGSDCAWVDFITLPPMLMVNAGENLQVCSNDPVMLTGSASNFTSLLWTTSGTGIFSDNSILTPQYFPSEADINQGSVVLTLTATHSTNSIADSITLSISQAAEAYAGPDAAICEGQNFSLSQSSASNHTSLIWTTSGSGTFSNPATLHPIYYPSASDISNGWVVLTLLAFSNSPCNNAYDNLLLSISSLPDADAGNDDSVCFGNDYTVTGATASNFDMVFWTTSGTGTFDDITLVNPTYTPSMADAAAGQVILTMNVGGIPPCGTISDQMALTIADMPAVPIIPSGPDTVNLAMNLSSLYTIEPVLHAQAYEWSIEPEGAGILVTSATEAVVYWDEAFEGEAEISVRALNDCGHSEFSELKKTWVHTLTIGIDTPQAGCRVSVSPNPSGGLFTLSLSRAIAEPCVISIYDLFGQEVYRGEFTGGLISKADIDLQHLQQGVYLLVLRSNRNTLNTKLVIKR